MTKYVIGDEIADARTTRSTVLSPIGWGLMASATCVSAQGTGRVQDIYGKVHYGAPESRCLADRKNNLQMQCDAALVPVTTP